MRMKKLLVLVIFLSFLCTGCASLSETSSLYRTGVKFLQGEDPVFAVNYLDAFLKAQPKSPYAPSAAFALGEFYFDNNDYFNSMRMFSDYIRNFPKHRGVIFAKLIIYKVLTNVKNSEVSLTSEEEDLIKEIRKELFSQPLFLMFYDKKSPRRYKSLNRNTYLVYDYVDKIKVFRNDKVFLELSP